MAETHDHEGRSLARHRGRRPDEARRVPRRRRLRQRLERARAMTSARGDRASCIEGEPARPRRRRSSRRAARRASSRRRQESRSRSTSSSTPTSRSRARSRTARSCCDVPHRLIEGCLIAAHAIESKHVFIYIRGEYLDGVRDPRRRARGGARGGAARRRRDHDPPRRRRVHLRRGDRAARVARGQARPAALEAAVPADPGPLRGADADQQRRDDRDRPDRSSSMGAAGVREDRRAARLDRHARLLPLRATSCGPATTSCRTGHRCAQLIYDIGGGIADGRELKAVIPGGSSLPVLTPDQIDTPLDYDSLGAIGHVLRLRRRSSSIDDRCCMVQLALRVAQFYMHESCGKCTPCRVGTRWIVQILARSRTGTATRARPRPARSTSATTSSASACARSATRRDAGRELRARSSATSSARTSSTAAARSAATRRSRGSSRRSTSTRTHRSARRHSYEHRARPRHDRRARRARPEGDGHRRDGARRRRSRSRSSATSRASARRSAPAACASSRSRACRSSRPAARSPRRTGWS